MHIERKENYILIKSGDILFKDFFDFFTSEHDNYSNNSVIVNISSKVLAKEEEISLFLDYGQIHQENGTSFVVVYPKINVDNFPDTFNIVPTLLEAEDLLEMENIQRDLGF